MATQIFVNLPVKDLDRSKAFFAKLGYSSNPKFTDATAACIVISDDIYVMLLTEAKVKGVVDTALSAGAVEAGPAIDYGYMFGRSFHDLDGHIWEIIWMDQNAATQSRSSADRVC